MERRFAVRYEELMTEAEVMCRVDEVEFGSFCELEYHAPALGALPEMTQNRNVSQVPEPLRESQQLEEMV